MKPQHILDLEKELGFELREMPKKDEQWFHDVFGIRHYMLNTQKKVIDLNLAQSNLKSVTCLTNLKELKTLNLQSNDIRNVEELKELIKPPFRFGFQFCRNRRIYCA